MKIAVTGKGGVGKTTIASLFIKVLARDGKEVLAVDCDPDSNLAGMLGFKEADKITPVAEMKDMIEERMGAKVSRSFFRLNPKIDDIPDKFSVKQDRLKLIVMGTVEEGGTGCMCPENAFVKNLLSHIVLERGEHIVMDMEAGIEHFGRGTAEACDFVITVVEPSINSITTAKRIAGFANDIGIKKIYAIGNKIMSEGDEEFIRENLGKIRLIGTFEFDKALLEWGRNTSSHPDSKKIIKKMEDIKGVLAGELVKN